MAGVVERARLVVKQAEQLAKLVATEARDKYDCEWEFRGTGLLERLFSTEYLDTLVLLGNATRKILIAQPVLAEVPSPAKIFGDIHGQLRDLLLLFVAFGFPVGGQEAPCFVFNGDFVDRGDHSLAVIGLLFALKVSFPKKIWLVRGNHEDKAMNEKYGFKDECVDMLGKNFGRKVYLNIHKVFDQLPVACLIAGKILCVHGGIGDGTWKLGDLRSIRRPLGSKEFCDPKNQWIVNLLWSDPIEEDDERMQGVFGVHPSPRGQFSSQFAWNVTRTFCARNGLGLIVRSHQSKQDSLGFSIMHDNMLVRVFSARDYEGHGNDGAVLSVQTVSYGDHGDLLTVRPQVLRSFSKAADEAIIHKLFEANEGDAIERRNTREDLALQRMQRRRQAIFRTKNRRIKVEQDSTDGQKNSVFKAMLWKLKAGGDCMSPDSWFHRSMWISKSGSLVYWSKRENRALIHFTEKDLIGAHIRELASGDCCIPWAFEVVLQNDSATSVTGFAADGAEMRSAWVAELRKLAARSGGTP